MRLIYRHFFNVSDRINYVSEAQRTMWDPRYQARPRKMRSSARP
jgi:hypothetical protein